MKFFAATMFYLLIYTGAVLSAEPPFIIIDSLSGRAEVQRESSFKWQLVLPGEKLFNNDQLRSLQASHIRLKYGDSTRIFINHNSQLKVNLIKSTSSIISHITLISGTAFFDVFNTSSKQLKNSISVYSPAVKASPLESSFLFSLQPNKSTEIQLLHGTLPVSKTIDGQNIFLGSPFKTTIGLNHDPFHQSALLQHEIDSLKAWIPPVVIDKIMEKQVIKWRRNFQILNGRLEDKCLITLLKNRSEYKGSWKIESNISRFLAWKLQSANRKTRSELFDSIVTDPIDLASTKKARFLITGEILSLNVLQHAEISAQADEYRESRIARVKLNISLIETQSADTLMSKTFTGEISQKRKNENSWESLQLLSFDLQDSTFSSSILGLAITLALDQAVETIIPKMENQ